jgi:SAM-dependent methyltransferase
MTGRDKRFVDGYVADSLYPSMFHFRFAPSWTDWLLVRSGLQPPRKPRGPFTLIDAGCGDGYGLILQAVANPEARFFGFDASAGHIARGNKLIRALKLPNIELKRMTLASAQLRLKADYVTCQGLLSWISRANQEALWRFVSRTLKPGGAFTVGYNTLPGWAPVIPFQRLVRAFADYLPGNSTDRFVAAFIQTSATGLVSDNTLGNVEQDMTGKWGNYVAHEYLNQFWDPLWSGDVIQAAEAHNLAFVRPAMEQRLRDDFALTKAQRTTLATIGNDRAREIAIDLFRNTGFRTDLFIKPGARALTPSASQGARLKQYWASRAPVDTVEYSCQTAAGKLRFDNRAARTIMNKLDNGPANLRAIKDVAVPDLLNTIDALFTAGLVRPVEPPIAVPGADGFNRRILSGQNEINALVGQNGVVLPMEDFEELDAGVYRRLGIAQPS